MKKLITFLLVTSIYTFSIAQTNDAVLNKRLAQYLNYSKKLDIDALLTYMYPKIFTIAPKNAIKNALSAAYASKDLKMSLDSMYINSVDSIQQFNYGQYTKFNYHVTLVMQLATEEYIEKKEAIKKSFIDKFGKENVQFIESTNTFYINQFKDALAIKDKISNNIWTFFGIDEENKGLTNIIPAAIKKKYNLN